MIAANREREWLGRAVFMVLARRSTRRVAGVKDDSAL
jgi:hypothetical protein